MPTLDGLRRQIQTANDLRSIVTTMKTLAAVSIHQYERAVEALADYNRTIDLGFQIAFRGHPYSVNPTDPAMKSAAIVFGSDQGMCGQFNEEIVAFLKERSNLREPEAGRNWVILAVGARVEDRLTDSGWPVEHAYQLPTSVSDISNLVQELLPDLERLTRVAGISRLYVYFNRRTSASSYASREVQLLPLDPARQRQWSDEPWEGPSLPMFRSDRQQVISRLLQHHLFVSLFRACAESLASENASRIAAMQAAEKNIEERLEDLNRSFHTLRQSAITEELLDVVNGFEALSKKQRKSFR